MPLDNVLDFIGKHLKGSDINPEILAKLRQLLAADKILFSHLGVKGNVAQWNQQAGTITINLDKVALHDFAALSERQATRALEAADPAEAASLRGNSERLLRLHKEQLVELSALLIHEGTHAVLGNSWRAKRDEYLAYQAEAAWLSHLHRVATDDWERARIESLGRDLLESSAGRTSRPLCRSLLPLG